MKLLTRRNRRFIHTIIAVLLITATILPVGTVSAASSAKITSITGDVQVMRGGGDKAFDAFKNMRLTEGDRIITGQGASVVLELDDENAVITLSENTRIYLSELRGADGTQETTINLQAGGIGSKVKSFFTSSSRYVVKTATAVMGVRGTEFFTQYEDGEVYLGVLEGAVELGVSTGLETYFETLEELQEIKFHEDTPVDTLKASGPTELNPENLDEIFIERLEEIAAVTNTIPERLSSKLKEAKSIAKDRSAKRAAKPNLAKDEFTEKPGETKRDVAYVPPATNNAPVTTPTQPAPTTPTYDDDYYDSGDTGNTGGTTQPQYTVTFYVDNVDGGIIQAYANPDKTGSNQRYTRGNKISPGDLLNEGANVLYLAYAEPGWKLQKWIINRNGDEYEYVDENGAIYKEYGLYTEALASNESVKVVFEQYTPTYYTVTYAITGAGIDHTLTAGYGSLMYVPPTFYKEVASGEQVESGKPFSFYAKSVDKTHFAIKQIYTNGNPSTWEEGIVPTNMWSTFGSINFDIEFIVEFEEIDHTNKNRYPVFFSVTTESEDYGTLSATANNRALENGMDVSLGTVITLSAEPLTGYKVEKWLINDAVFGGTIAYHGNELELYVSQEFINNGDEIYIEVHFVEDESGGATDPPVDGPIVTFNNGEEIKLDVIGVSDQNGADYYTIYPFDQVSIDIATTNFPDFTGYTLTTLSVPSHSIDLMNYTYLFNLDEPHLAINSVFITTLIDNEALDKDGKVTLSLEFTNDAAEESLKTITTELDLTINIVYTNEADQIIVQDLVLSSIPDGFNPNINANKANNVYIYTLHEDDIDIDNSKGLVLLKYNEKVSQYQRITTDSAFTLSYDSSSSPSAITFKKNGDLIPLYDLGITNEDSPIFIAVLSDDADPQSEYYQLHEFVAIGRLILADF